MISTFDKLDDACETQSARMSRPSASVLLISTVLPECILSMSSLRMALGPMAFSTMARMRVSFVLTCSWTAVLNPSNTPALPPCGLL